MRIFFRRLQTLSRLIFTPYRPLRRLINGLFVGIIVGGLMAAGLWQGLFGSVRTRLKDALYQSRPTSGIVTVIAVDDASLAAYGRSLTEWPRSVHTDLVRLLDEADARVIAFDVLFIQPSPDDAELADAMRRARNVIQPVIGGQHGMSTTRAGNLIAYDYFIYPAPELEAAAMGLGHANIIPDDDGFARKVPLFVRSGDERVPALSLAAYLEYLHMLPEMVEIGDNMVRFAGRDLYTDDFGQMLISYFGPPSRVDGGGTFPVYSLVDVVEGRVSPEVFEDQIVLIGVLDAAALPDSYPTPNVDTGDQMFGVEIHANAIETIHQSLPAFRQTLDWELDLGLFSISLYHGTTSFPLRDLPLRTQLAITFALAVGLGALLPFLRWYVGLALVVVVYGGYLVWASAAFTLWSRVVELLFPAFSLAFTFLGTMIVGYVFEERRRGQINDLFSRYVSPEIAQKVVEAFDRGRLELGGEEREITVLFADIRGFTPLSEGLPPQDVVGLLNMFLEEMNIIVMRYGGAINKYIGDNIMAFWNAPYPQADHVWLATQAGIDMLVAIDRLNAAREFASPVQFGIGINTGVVVVGNIGSQRRLEYTLIGDTVNVASRLSGVAPGGTCYVGARTYDLIADRVRPVQVHRLMLKGKQSPVEIYELTPESLGDVYYNKDAGQQRV
ncbi:MAG: adenylate/guanylate cyclase domain-containing protein [Anaerolineae bacterium]|nr:adenylate/guanylate cyclase domain-containing protein [Anaerolineae bacterium]